jgi:hypothetical protein
MRTDYIDTPDHSSAGASRTSSIERLGRKKWRVEGFDAASVISDHTSARIPWTIEEAITDFVVGDVGVHVRKRISDERFLIAETRVVSDQQRHEALLTLSSALQLISAHGAPSLRRALFLMHTSFQALYTGEHIVIYHTNVVPRGTSLVEWGRRDESPAKDLPTWLTAFKTGGVAEEPTTRALADLIAHLEGALEKGDFALLDDVMDKLDMTSVHPTVIVAILRVTYPMRRSLEGWLTFRDRVRAELKRQRLNVDKILRGLTQ